MSLRLLCLTAHPDDECYAFGGALALAAKRGVETSVVCFTDGQAAANRGTASTSRALGKMRREEFEASSKVLGVAHSEVLDYDDGKLDHTDFLKIATEIVTRIRSFRPHVVLTFGADGGANTHPDHALISLATTAAFHWAGHPKRLLEAGALHQAQRLYHQTTDFFLPDRHKPLPAPWTLKLDITEVFDQKLEAFRAHTSQAPLMEQTRELFLKHGKYELFSLAASMVPQPALQSTDMFDGVAE